MTGARDQGRKEGKIEEIKTGIKEVAKKMLAEKMDIDVITKVTGLTKEEIEEL